MSTPENPPATPPATPPTAPAPPTPAPAVVPPAPAPAPRAASVSEDDAPEGWSSKAAYRRFQEATQKARVLEQEKAAAQAEVERLKAEAAAHQQRAAAQAARHAQDLVFERTATQHDHFRHDSVRQLFRDGYERYRASAGDAAAAFGDWIGMDEVKADPVYGAHFTAPATAQPPATAATTPTVPGTPPVPAAPRSPAAAPPNPNTGAVPTPIPGSGHMSHADIGTLARNPAAWKAQRAAARRQLEAELGCPLSSTPLPDAGE